MREARERQTPVERVRREKKTPIFSVSTEYHSPFSSSIQTFCLTARAYLNKQKYGLFCGLGNSSIAALLKEVLTGLKNWKNWDIIQVCIAFTEETINDHRSVVWKIGGFAHGPKTSLSYPPLVLLNSLHLKLGIPSKYPFVKGEQRAYNKENKPFSHLRHVKFFV